MGHKFERERMERLPDGSVNIGIRIVPTVGATDEVDKSITQSCEWARCEAQHIHGWGTCDVRSLFNAREQRQRLDAEGKLVVDAQDRPVLEDVPGTSRKERLVAWLDGRRAAAGGPRGEIQLPKKTVTRNGKQEEIEDKEVAGL